MKQNYPDASRIWERVLPQEPREQQTLQVLIWQLGQDISHLKRLSRSGEDAAVDLLMKEYTEQLHCLRGIVLLIGGSSPRQSGSISDNSLTRCFDNALRRLGAFQLRSSDPVYGPVFRDLSRQTEQHCRIITQLLGRKEKGR